MKTPGEVVNACPHNQTRQFCQECKHSDAKALAKQRHPSRYGKPEHPSTEDDVA